MLFKLSNLISNLALTLGYINPALNNSAQDLCDLTFNWQAGAQVLKNPVKPGWILLFFFFFSLW